MLTPIEHQKFVDTLVDTARADSRICGVGLLGSHLRDEADPWSDIDLVLITDDPPFEHDERIEFAERVDGFLVGWKPDYLGVDMLMSLYAPDLHVEMKFVAREDVPALKHGLKLAWSRGAIELPSEPEPASWRSPDVQNIEDQFWIGMNYLRRKIGRGEYFEAAASLDFVRMRMLLPLLEAKYETRLAGYRRLEERDWPELERLRAAFPAPTNAELLEAASAIVELYVELRDEVAPADLIRHARARRAMERGFAEMH